VSALLKRDHGIEVKSASSTIEEVVARQFVDRLAKQRNITLPTGDIFAETPVVKGKKGQAPAKKAEPAKPAAPMLPPPRLVKTAKPVAVHEAEPAEVVAEPEPLEEPAAVEAVAESEPAPAPVMEAPAAAPPAPAPVESPKPVEAASAPPAVEPAAAPVPVAAAPAPPPAPAVRPPTPGRVVPPTLRLRIEEQRPATTAPLSTTPGPRVAPRPAVRTERPAVPVRPPAPTGPLPAATGNLARPGAPGSPRPAGMPPPRPSYPGPNRPTPGGPRPLPSQPIRTQQPGTPPRPGQGQYPQRPGMPYRPPMRSGGRPSSGPRRDPRPSAPVAPAAPPPVTRTITLAEGMTVKDLADKLDLRVKDVLAKLLMKRLMLTINSTLDTETATMIAREFGAEVTMRSFEEELLQVDSEESKAEDIVTRAPVVTVMGHVDHGKTSLLDAIREARVAEREAGGITQHIGAYHVTINGRNIVFLDTPGHEAFTLMRARGAKVTDIVILVVAADDGVMPQTREAIDHAKAAGVPIIVAINKIDKPNASPEKVKRELTELDLMPEEWGGKTVTVEVSAKKKLNIDQLLEMILLVADIGELKANPKRNASGTVLEAKLDKGRGPVATILVQDGTLNVGDTFIAGPVVGRVRALIDDRGKPVKSAGPSMPVEVLGLTGLPQPGDSFQALADAAKARQIATFRQDQAKVRSLGAKGGRLTLESLQAPIAEGGMKELPIIIKADVQGSAEVLADTLGKLTDDRVKIRIIHSGVGAVNESDVLLASASNAIVIAFNVRPDRNAEAIAQRERVDIRTHSVIYNVTDEMKKAMTGLLDPTFKEVRIGVAEVRDTFKVPKFGTIAGCLVREGRITRSGDTQARLLRDGVVVYEGKIGSLRRFKDDASEVKAGLECGIGFEKFNDLKVGDMIEVFAMERVLTTA
jgi:translation initiation factor IF-2